MKLKNLVTEKMNINKIVLTILLGAMVLELNAKPKYRIQTWVSNGQKQYLPQKRVWYRTNYFYLPFRVWHSGSYSFQTQSQAEEIIQNWKNDKEEKRKYKQSIYIEIE